MAAKKKKIQKPAKKAQKKSPTKPQKSAVKTAPKKQAAPKQQVKTSAKPKAAKSSPKINRQLTEDLIPYRDGVLVQRSEEPDRTPGGLIIPVSAMERPLKGVVVNAGKGSVSKNGKLRPLDVKAGDEVVFSKYAGTEVHIDGETYLLMREHDILGVVS